MSHALPTTAPPPLKIPIAARVVAAIATLLGAGAFAWSLSQGHADVAWSSYLIGTFYALSLGVFGVVGIYLKFLAVLVSLTGSCLKLAVDSMLERAVSAGLSRRLFARKS